MAGAQQGLKGSGLVGGGGARPVSLRAVGPAPGWDPGGRGSGGTAKERVFRHGVVRAAEGRASRVCGSRTELWPGAAPGADSPAEQSSGFADLWGRDLAGQVFLY
jgi:hypothetical protein